MASWLTEMWVAAADVDHFAGEWVCTAGGEEVGVDDVVDVGEVAGLLAVAVDEGALAGERWPWRRPR